MIRRRLLVNGIVQGVGFRPFVARTAARLGLKGHVQNTSAGVVIEVEGPAPPVAEFERRLQHEAPRLAQVVSLQGEELPAVGQAGFKILPSSDTPGTSTLIPPDVATCADCLREVRDPADRRHGYSFTNCTNCGPRWTIMAGIPYDRARTTMSPFVMCEKCRAEYDDIEDRRYHAQPNACPDCGPRVWLSGPLGAIDGVAEPLAKAAEALARHAVLAIRGLGGFHLAVRADDAAAVRQLRSRKRRLDKPLAVMVPDVATARSLAHLTDDEQAQLSTATAPIVLVARRADASLAPEVAPGQRTVGLMLPATPLHHLLFDALAPHGITALVMTSGNVSDEPICLSNEDAQRRLAAIADAFVLHDREILRRADDSVMQVVDGVPSLLRRARGLAPVPVFMPDAAGLPPILATGGQLKNTICLFKEGRAFLSPHIGDLGQVATDAFFRESVAALRDLLECAPAIIAHDLHPGYAATAWALQQGKHDAKLRLHAVQHHHAHLAAVMAEHQLADRAIGLIMDGTGYGPDETIWGGEILWGDAAGFKRVGHFEPVPLPGGDAAIKAPWRQAVSYLRHSFGPQFFVDHPDEFPFQADRPVAAVLEILERGLNSPLTSSCGRLFDAVAALVGPWTEVSYEAQAAREFMALTTVAEVRESDPFRLVVTEFAASLAETGAEEMLVLPVKSVIRAVREAKRAGVSAARISAMFHRTLCEVLTSAAVWTAARYHTKDVVLGGGVFQNDILHGELRRRLRREGLRAWSARQVPPGDGGLSLGQAAVAAAQIRQEREAGR